VCCGISATATASAICAPEARAALQDLLGQLDGRPIPETLISQYLPRFYDRVVAGALRPEPRPLLLEAIRDVLRTYSRACRVG